MVQTMDFIKEFSQINKGDAASAGGKGASLGELTRAGIPVPPGFVILAGAFERFLAEADLNAEIDTILHTVNQQEMHTIENASEKIQALIVGAKMPEDIGQGIRDFYKKPDAGYVAVRSSATAEDSASAAWAGQLDTFLNTTEDTLLANVQKCWASLFTPRAIFYRLEKELHKQKISVAVVVQKMVQSEVSGIAFSVHPVTEDRNQLIIEAGFGLGEAIVSGAITPDSYVIEKNPRRIIEKNITYQSRALWRAENGGNEWHELSQEEGSKPALSDEQALELAELILRIENHYGFPCDIEWAYEAGHFYITQSRPITTLTRKTKVQAANAYVGEVDVSRPNVLERLYTREIPIFAFAYWTEDILNHLGPLLGKKFIHSMLILSEGDKAERAGIYYLNGELVAIFEGLQKKILEKPEFFDTVEKSFISTLKKLGPVLAVLKKKPAKKSFEEFLKKYFEWYYGNLAFMHSVVDLVDVPDSIRKRALTLRGQTQELDADFGKIVRNALEKIYPKYRHLLYYLLPEEFALLETDISPKKEKEILERKDGWFFLNGKFYAGHNSLQNELKKAGLLLGKKSVETQKEIHGTVAVRGKVQGTVRVIQFKKEIALLKDGEILVTAMTSPDYVSAMKRSGAIVTDEGGMTCHAAIVSRELGKPCVIGTKIATQVLHDGDLVEVDAGKGVVRIIK